MAAPVTLTLCCFIAASFACRGDQGLRDILYVSQPGSTEDIHALRLADASSRIVIAGDSMSSRSLPRWAPTGGAVAFIREYGDSVQLYVVDSLTGTPRQLAAGLAPFIYFPDWSPDGHRLLFAAGSSLATLSVWSINHDGTELQVVLGDSAGYRCPSWAPDGQRFVVSSRTRRGTSALLLVDACTKEQQVLMESDSTLLDCPQWSPKGHDILMTVVHRCRASWSDCGFKDIDTDLQVLHLSSGEVTSVTRDRNMSNYGAWSPNGDWIVFQSDQHAPPGWGLQDTLAAVHRFDSLEIYIVRPDGSDLRRLTANQHFDAHPSW